MKLDIFSGNLGNEFFNFKDAMSNLSEELSEFIDWDLLASKIDYQNKTMLTKPECEYLVHLIEFKSDIRHCSMYDCSMNVSDETFDVTFGDQQSYESGGGDYISFEIRVGFDGVISSIDRDMGCF